MCCVPGSGNCCTVEMSSSSTLRRISSCEGQNRNPSVVLSTSESLHQCVDPVRSKGIEIYRMSEILQLSHLLTTNTDAECQLVCFILLYYLSPVASWCPPHWQAVSQGCVHLNTDRICSIHLTSIVGNYHA